MAAAKVTDPTGQRWRVKRQWAPRLEGRGLRARYRQRRDRRRQAGKGWSSWVDVPAGDFSDSLAAVAVVVVGLVLVVFLVVVGAPLVLAVIDLVVVAGVVIGGVVARVLFRRPWTVEAVADDGRRSATRAVGWRASARARDELAERIGGGLAPDHGTGPG